MKADLKYGEIVSGMDSLTLMREIKDSNELLMGEWMAGAKKVQMAWAPFDSISSQAKVAIVGITPGREQMQATLRAYHRLRSKGVAHEKAMIEAKSFGAFSGTMRGMLVDLLDCIGVNEYLDVKSTSDLFNEGSQKLHLTSCLRWPVFVDGKNYSGSSPTMSSFEPFRKQIVTTLVPELQALPKDCLIIPCGARASEIVQAALRNAGGFDMDRFIERFPHPSGAARDVSYQFLGMALSSGRAKAPDHSIRQHAEALRARVLRMKAAMKV